MQTQLCLILQPWAVVWHTPLPRQARKNLRGQGVVLRTLGIAWAMLLVCDRAAVANHWWSVRSEKLVTTVREGDED